MAIRLRRILGPAIQLSALEGERHPVWIQATTEGSWKGHPAHDLVEFTEQTFKEVIANFRRNPAYKTDERGVGCAPVIRLDYEHISEMDPTMVAGAATEGIPAPGFIYELEMRDGADGKLQLWAFVEMTQKLWEQVQDGEYKWTSVAIDPASRDRTTNEPIGHELTSLAITNNPFVLGMEPMNTNSTESRPSARVAASKGYGYGFCLLEDTSKRGAKRRIACAMEMWGEAETPEEAVIGIRGLFDLPAEAPPADCLIELNTFAGMLEAGTVPAHIDADYIQGRLRTIVGLRLLATWTEVLEAARSALSAAIEKSTPGGGNVPPPVQSPPASSAQSAISENTMSTKTLSARLASSLNLPADADDDTVVDRVKALLSASTAFKARVRKKLSKVKLKKAKLSDSEEDENKLVDAVEETADAAETAEAAAEAVNAIEQLLEILGSENVTEVLSRATKLTEDVKKFGPMVEELNALKARLSEGEVKEAEEEVAAIAASYKLEERAKNLLSACVFSEETVDGKTVRRLNKAGLETIRKDWPLSQDAMPRHLLTKSLIAGSGGVQLGGSATGAGQVIDTSVKPAPKSKADEAREKYKFCAGKNDVEQAISYLESENAAFATLDYREQCFLAGQFVRTGELPK